ncbi:MAG: hypothetical protein JF616_10525, partial [Fibrobacteres bacterium]|nr:hypothetical protein [Fibrobacterota bacterium]
LYRSLDELFYSLVVAATTSVAGMLTLLTSKFVGFYEFGVQASAGIAFSLIGVYVLLPAFVFAWESLTSLPGLGWLALRSPPVLRWPFKSKPDWRKVARWSAGAVLVGTAILGCFTYRLKFEYDFDRLRDTRKEPDGLPVKAALGSNRTSSQPVVVMAQDSASMAALQDTLLQRLSGRDPFLRSFLTLSTFDPPAAAQAERIVEIRHIGDLVAARVFDKAKGNDSAMITNLRELARTEPFGAADIPPWALNLLRERDGSYGKLGFVYGSYNSSNALEAGKFQDRYGHLTAAGKKLACYCSSFVFSDIVRMVKSDSIRVFIWMLAGLVVLLALILRDRRLLLACGIQLVVGVIWIVG